MKNKKLLAIALSMAVAAGCTACGGGQASTDTSAAGDASKAESTASGDNTVIVAYADHYLYTLDDKSILDKYKETSNNLINHTPFFIWSSDLGQLTSISKVNMQMDILPTVLNLFGIDYNSNNYIGHDILSNDFKGYAFFSDYSWYDGKVYVENQQITNGKKMSKDKLDTMNNLISNVIKKNDLTLKYDYFKSK